MREYPNAPVAWDVEDGDGQIGIENPPNITSVGEAILNMWSPEQILEFAQDAHGSEVAWEEWEEWDFSDPGQVADWVIEDVYLDTAAWHVPDDIYNSEDWSSGYGRIIKNQPWHFKAPEGYTRVVWVQL